MAIRYNMQVININTHLNIRSGAGTQYPVVGSYSNGNTFIADGTQSTGSVTWYHIENTNNWCAGNSSGGVQYLKIIADLSGSSTSSAKNTTQKATKKVKAPTKTTAVNIEDTIGDLNSNSKLGIPKYRANTNKAKNNKSSITSKVKNVGDGYDKSLSKSIKRDKLTSSNIGNYIRITSAKYPKVTTKKNPTTGKQRNYSVDYSLTISKSIRESVKAIKKDLETPTAFGRSTLNTNVHRKFNRFQKDFPDLYLRTSRAVVFFTRPDLNLFTESHAVNSQIKLDNRDYYILLKDKELGRLLTEDGGAQKSLRRHNFNPLLSNLTQSLEIQDDSVDTVDMGETIYQLSQRIG